MTEAHRTSAGHPPPWREQRENQQKSGTLVLRRTFHAKIVVGVGNAEFAFVDDLPAELSAGHFIPGSRLPVTVRLSNASGTVRSDSAPACGAPP
jgi:hypothetical protein